MLTETAAASRAAVWLRTPGASSQAFGAGWPEGTASTITTGGPITARTGAPVPHAVAAKVGAAGAVVVAGVPAFSARKRANAVPSFLQRQLGSAVIVSVRKQTTYMTRVIANRGDSSGSASMEVAGLG